MPQTTREPFFSVANQIRLKASMEQLDAGKGVVHELIEIDEDEALYNVALEVERDAALATEMREWREGLARDGVRGTEYGGGEHNAAR